MEANRDLLQDYMQLLATSNQMLLLAREGRWDELITHEVGYLAAVESLTQRLNISEVSQRLQAQIRPILKQILDNEVQIKDQLHQRMEELKVLVGQSSIQHNLNTTYGRLAGNILFPNEL